MMKIDIKKEDCNWAFSLFKKDIALFSIGKGDILIMKENYKNECYWEQKSFNYPEGKEDILIGKTGSNEFTVKRIIVIQMEETKESKQIKEEKMKKQIEEENKKLKENEIKTKEQYSKEIKQIEEWSEIKYKEVIFDTSINDWDVFTSEFDRIIFGKEKLVFIIEDTENNVFGCYINSKIDKYQYLENNEVKGSPITDPKAFIFSMRNNGRSKEMIKIPIKKEDSNWAFILYKKEWGILFGIGRGHDICIMKENNKNQCYCVPLSFEYPE